MYSQSTQPKLSIEGDFADDFDLAAPNALSPSIQEVLAENGITDSAESMPKIEVEKHNHRWILRGDDDQWYRVIKIGNRLNIYPGEHRHYTSTPLPTLHDQAERAISDTDLLLSIYKEVNQNWRFLSDVRFKLLGFLPAVSVIAWIGLINETALREIPGSLSGLLFSALGLTLSVAIRTYDLRNDALYNDLISRGRKIEEEIGVDTGIFRGRRRGSKWINHSTALRLIYGGVNLGWLFLILWFVEISLRPMG